MIKMGDISSRQIEAWTKLAFFRRAAKAVPPADHKSLEEASSFKSKGDKRRESDALKTAVGTAAIGGAAGAVATTASEGLVNSLVAKRKEMKERRKLLEAQNRRDGISRK